MDSQHCCKEGGAHACHQPYSFHIWELAGTAAELCLLEEGTREERPGHDDSKGKALHHTSLSSDTGKSSCETQLLATKWCIHSGHQKPGLLSCAVCSTAHKNPTYKTPNVQNGW